VVGEPDEMIPGAIVSGFQMTDGIAPSTRSRDA